MRYTIDQRRFIVTEYFANNKDFKVVIGKFELKYGIKAPKKESMVAMLTKWNEHGTVHDRIKGVSGRKCERGEGVEIVREEIANNPGLSLRRGAQALQISKSSLHRVLKTDLGCRPYKVLKRHHIPQGSSERRVIQSRNMLGAIEEDPSILQKLWFSDEAHFELSHPINKQNDRNWCTTQPYLIVEKPLHAKRTTVWAAVSAKSTLNA